MDAWAAYDSIVMVHHLLVREKPFHFCFGFDRSPIGSTLRGQEIENFLGFLFAFGAFQPWARA